MTPQPIAEPAGGPSSARVETCGTCGQRITRPDVERGRWRHDDRTVTHADAGPVVLLLAGHELSFWSRRGVFAHCLCGEVTDCRGDDAGHAVHLAEVLDRAGLLKGDT
jgi:hypothetical protein